MLIEHKELGQRSKAELESLFGNMYAGWDRGVVVTQERFGDGETRFSERPMSSMELAARYVAAGANIYEIAGRAAFAPIVRQVNRAIAILFALFSTQPEAKSPYLIVCQGARCAVTSDSACNLLACYRGHKWYPPIPKHWIPES